MSTFLNQIDPRSCSPSAVTVMKCRRMAKSFAYLPSVPSRRANPRTVVRPSSMEHVLATSVSAARTLRGSMVVSIIAMMPSPMSVFFMVLYPTPWLLFFICSFVDILIFRGFFQQEESAGLSGEVFFLLFLGGRKGNEPLCFSGSLV